MPTPLDRDDRLRVAHISLGLDVGGQERLLVEFARHADRAKYALTFVSLTGRGKLAAQLEELGWPIVTLHERPGLRPGMIWRLARLFRRHRFDVVHTHDDRPLLYGAGAVKLARISRFVHTHHHGFLAGVPAKRMCLIRLAAGLANDFVCVSRDSARFMSQWGLSNRQLQVIWNGIDVERFAFQGPQTGGPAVTVARLSPEKDVANLVRAVELVVRAVPDFRLEVAGDGPCRRELETLVANLGLTNSISFLGEVSAVPELLSRASLFVLPSKTEGISLTILESMARGLPVVATSVGGNPEVVVPGETGLLVPSADPQSLSKAIVQLWNRPQQASTMGRAGRTRVEQYFNIRRMVAEYEALYGKCRLRNDGRVHNRQPSQSPTAGNCTTETYTANL